MSDVTVALINKTKWLLKNEYFSREEFTEKSMKATKQRIFNCSIVNDAEKKEKGETIMYFYQLKFLQWSL